MTQAEYGLFGALALGLPDRKVLYVTNIMGEWLARVSDAGVGAAIPAVWVHPTGAWT